MGASRGCRGLQSIRKLSTRHSNAKLAPASSLRARYAARDYLQEVRHSNSERTVYVGPEAVIVEMSEGVRQKLGNDALLRRDIDCSSPARGGTGDDSETSCRDWSSCAEFRCLERDCLRHARRTAGTRWPWRRHVQHSPFPHIIEMNSTPISKEDFEATNQKLLVRTR